VVKVYVIVVHPLKDIYIKSKEKEKNKKEKKYDLDKRQKLKAFNGISTAKKKEERKKTTMNEE
jgi:hypothetical protein